MNQTTRRGIVYAAFDNDKLTLACADSNDAQVRNLEYNAPAKLDINSHILAIAGALANVLPNTREIALYEDDPRSRETADFQNFTKRAIATLAHACGLQLRSVHTINAEALLLVTLPDDAPESAYEAGRVTAMKLAAWDRTAKNNLIPFGNVVRRSDLRRARSLRTFDELVGGAYRRKWSWHGYEALRDRVLSRPVAMWQRAEGIV
jgi:hypothetical protein